jgi:hypothetical protein
MRKSPWIGRRWVVRRLLALTSLAAIPTIRVATYFDAVDVGWYVQSINIVDIFQTVLCSPANYLVVIDSDVDEIPLIVREESP